MSLSYWMKRFLAKPSRATRGNFAIECLEGRITPASVASGVPVGSAPIVRVLDAITFQPVARVTAYDSGFTGGVNVALGDVTGDGVADLITGTTTGASHVKVFDGLTFQQVRSFLAFPGFTGGINVAAGDVNGDGKADIVVSVASAGPPRVAVFSGADGSVLQSFLAYGSGFTGGVSVAVGDVNGDGKADIVTGSGPGASGHVKVFSGADGSELRSFIAFSGFNGGFNVAVGDLDGDGKADIVVGAGPGAGPHVKAFSGATGEQTASFFAYDTGFSGGVFVGVNGDGDIVTGAAGTSHVKTFDGVTQEQLTSALSSQPVGGPIASSTAAPAVTLTTTASDPTSTAPISFTATFDTGVNGFSAAGVAVTNGSVSNFVAVSAATYTFEVTPTAAGSVTVTVPTGVATDASGIGNAASTPVSLTYVAAPTVTSVSPTSGPTAGGTTVTITGTNLTGATAVTFGGVAATSFTVNSATQITAVAPAGAAGAADVAVTTTVGTATATAAFTYVAAPTVTSVSPNAGPVAGGNTVVITGTGFTGATLVTFDTANAGPFFPPYTFTVDSDTQITVVVPPAAGGVTGPANVRVYTMAGTGTALAAYTYV